MIDNETASYYLEDLIPLIKEQAIEANQSKREKELIELKNKEDWRDYYYASGELNTYRKIIVLLQEEAGNFGVSLEELDLDDIREAYFL